MELRLKKAPLNFRWFESEIDPTDWRRWTGIDEHGKLYVPFEDEEFVFKLALQYCSTTEIFPVFESRGHLFFSAAWLCKQCPEFEPEMLKEQERIRAILKIQTC